MHAHIVLRRNTRSENKLFVFESRGFRTRFWQKVSESAFTTPAEFGKVIGRGNLKNRVHSGKPVRNREDLEKKTRSFTRTLLKRPVHVRSYFKHPKVVYTA